MLLIIFGTGTVVSFAALAVLFGLQVKKVRAGIADLSTEHPPFILHDVVVALKDSLHKRLERSFLIARLEIVKWFFVGKERARYFLMHLSERAYEKLRPKPSECRAHSLFLKAIHEHKEKLRNGKTPAA